MSDSAPLPPAQTIVPRLAKAVAILLVAGGGIVGMWEGIQYARLHLALRHAHSDFDGKQYLRAEFWATRALNVDNKNLEAIRLMADAYEAQDQPVALHWRIKVAQREPHNNEAMMLWAKSAYRFGQRDMAVNVLKSLPPEFQNQSADYHALMAGEALTEGNAHSAEEHFARAAELDHTNPVHRINLATFRLVNSPSKDVRAAAIQDLRDAATDPKARLLATQALLADAIRNRDRENALKWADQLRKLPEHTLADELSCLDITPTEENFKSALADFEKRAGGDAQKAIAMGDWLNAHHLAPETIRWHAQLAPTIQSNVRLQITVAEAYEAMADWKGLAAFLRTCRWDAGDFLRRALVIRTQRELSQPWEKDWNQLVADTEANQPNGFLLAHLALGWNWRPEALKLLWDASTKPRTNAIALQKLWDLYTATNDTRELLHVARAQTELDPENPALKNNEAFFSLLLNGTSSRAERLAREAFTSNPQVPEWAATYAYALHLAGKDAAAQKVMSSLPPEAVKRPGIALYLAIALAANGDQAQAREALAKLNARGMLPEERKLAADLAQQLNVAQR